MNTQQRRIHLSRLAIAGAFLLAGLAGTGQVAIAGPPLVDTGGSGSSTATDGPSLVGSGPEREIVASTDEVPSLVGSNSEREIVADTDGQHIAGALDETARSIDLAALRPQASTNIAVAPTEARFGQPY